MAQTLSSFKEQNKWEGNQLKARPTLHEEKSYWFYEVYLLVSAFNNELNKPHHIP
jgi:hypothetical protein